MKKNNEKIYGFLRSNDFELIRKDTSAFLGDYYDIFTNGSFLLKFSNSKSFETIDIRNSKPNENFYDLALVKALLYDRNYLTTKKRLEELGNERVKQMFPSIRK